MQFHFHANQSHFHCPFVNFKTRIGNSLRTRAICKIQIKRNLSVSCKFLWHTDIAKRCRGTSIPGTEIVYL